MYVGLHVLEMYWDLKVYFNVLLNTICVHCYDLRTLVVVTPVFPDLGSLVNLQV